MKNLPAVLIAADDREWSSGVIDHLQKMENVRLEIKRLERGDYIVDGRIVVERKSLIDFVTSIKDGRLFKQAHRLAISSFQPVFVLEGTAADLVLTQMRREAIQGALTTLAIQFSIPILRSKGPGETAQLLVYAARQACVARERVLYSRHKRPGRKRRQQLLMLQAIPGIGAGKASSLLEDFHNIHTIVNAESQRLAEVRGIGLRMADRIYRSFR
jgi:DNA excision repair protein ERCC-4